MNHRKGFNKLNRNASHRKALIRNMSTVLFKHERIETTKAKALEVRRHAEKMITRAKVDSVHNRRVVGEKIKDEAVLAKLFTDIGPRMKERNGGYTRVLKLGFRAGDAAEMVVLELVDFKLEGDKQDEKKAAKGKKAEKADKPAAKAEKKVDKKADKKAEGASKNRATAKAKPKAKAEKKAEEPKEE